MKRNPEIRNIINENPALVDLGSDFLTNQPQTTSNYTYFEISRDVRLIFLLLTLYYLVFIWRKIKMYFQSFLKKLFP